MIVGEVSAKVGLARAEEVASDVETGKRRTNDVGAGSLEGARPAFPFARGGLAS